MPRSLTEIIPDLDRAHAQTAELARSLPLMRPALAALSLTREAIAAIQHDLALLKGAEK